MFFDILEKLSSDDINKKEKIIKNVIDAYIKEDNESFDDNIVLLQK